MEMIVRQVVVCDDGKIIIMETMRIFMERDRERERERCGFKCFK